MEIGWPGGAPSPIGALFSVSHGSNDRPFSFAGLVALGRLSTIVSRPKSACLRRPRLHLLRSKGKFEIRYPSREPFADRKTLLRTVLCLSYNKIVNRLYSISK